MKSEKMACLERENLSIFIRNVIVFSVPIFWIDIMHCVTSLCGLNSNLVFIVLDLHVKVK